MLNRKTGCLFEPEFVRQGTPVFKYITRRSFFRPRDVIVYLNKIRSHHIENKTGLYTSSELYGADRDASTSIYNEIIDEWTNQFPEIEDILTVLQSIGIETFNTSEFMEKHAKVFANQDEWKAKEHLLFLFEGLLDF